VTLAGMLGARAQARGDISAHLDAIDAQQRIAESLGLSKDQQRRLWAIASADPGEVQELVGEQGPAVFAGRNTLGLFTRFEKRFARDDGGVIG